MGPRLGPAALALKEAGKKDVGFSSWSHSARHFLCFIHFTVSKTYLFHFSLELQRIHEPQGLTLHPVCHVPSNGKGGHCRLFLPGAPPPSTCSSEAGESLQARVAGEAEEVCKVFQIKTFSWQLSGFRLCLAGKHRPGP